MRVLKLLKRKKINSLVCGLAAVFLCTQCTKADEKISPQIQYSVRDTYLKQLPSPFTSLSPEEKATDWGNDYSMGLAFAQKKLDLYEAKVHFERAGFKIQEQSPTDELIKRDREIAYYKLLCYYLGKQYPDVVNTFEESNLRTATAEDFKPFNDLLIMLYESYEMTGDTDNATLLKEQIELFGKKDAQKIELGTALKTADLASALATAENSPYKEGVEALIEKYNLEKKSVATAQTLNALLPGAGFFYLGETRSGFTALAINGLFIAAAYQFFHKGQTAAGIIATSFEAGWYFGGIYGAGEDARLYNARVWEKNATPYMHENNLFPTLQLRFAF